MSKRIALFSDGTGNSSAKAEKTNVWRLFQALDQTRADQIAKYDDGVGTSSNKFLAIIGGAFGWGLKRNVIDLYKFVCRNYERGDDIYGFGFSRGSFTIRVLVDLIATEGLVTFRSEEELSRNAAAAYRHYRSKQFPSWSPFVVGMRWLRDLILWAKDRIKGYASYQTIKQRMAEADRANVPIRFLGLWDTVEAYGMPIAALKRGIDWVLWPMLFGDLILSPRVQRACHALSLDDERATFHPLLWDEVAEAAMVAGKEAPPGRITQVWFAGVHSNVGGGYPEDQLSLVSLHWMMRQAIDNGLVLEPLAVEQVRATKSPYARRYDSRAGFASYYRYSPREIRVRLDANKTRILPIIHGSVITRMAYGSDSYAPISLPHEFWVLAPDGELLAMEGAPLSLKMDATKKRVASAAPTPQAVAATGEEKARLLKAIDRLARPDREMVRFVWDTVFWRQCVYVVTVTLTTVLVLYPWLGGIFANSLHALLRSTRVGAGLDDRFQLWVTQVNESSRGPIASIVDAIRGLIPSYASPWIKVLEEHPLEFFFVVAAIVVSFVGGNVLRERIQDRARLAWTKDFGQAYFGWLGESQKGTRNSLVVASVIAIASLLFVFVFGGSTMAKLDLAVLVGVLVTLLGLRKLGRRPVAHSTNAQIQGTLALSVARYLRNNRFLNGVYNWVFERIVPIFFALLLVVAGWEVANRALFDVVSATGYFCNGTVGGGADKPETTGASTQSFRTDTMCWSSGLVLREGRRYRITLSTPGDWFDRTIRADVAGFPAASFRHVMATPLMRWWTENWFRPIARIGVVGNDEYVLKPSEAFDPYGYPQCPDVERTTDGDTVRAKITDAAARKLMACAPTPDDRRTLVTHIRARTTGELFLYVNDAVLMLPGLTDLFYSNNSGTGTISVERITELAPATP